MPVESYDDDRYLVCFSRLGKVKKSPLSEYRTADVDGLLDMKLADGDSVVAALLSRGQGEYFVTSDNAQTLRFSDENLRAQGRVGQGVTAMALGQGASVVSASYLDREQSEADGLISVLVVTERGTIKKVPLNQYPPKGRATGGVVTTELLSGDRVLLTTLVEENDSLLVIWFGENGEKGEQALAIRASDLKMLPRARKGVPLINGRVLGIVKL